jgi:peptidyl-prolyl cis-trans isomerase A (cyclophilin A)
MIRTSLFALFATTALLAQVPPAAPAAPAREPGLYATITTSMGPIVCILYEKESPITVKNFVALARGGTKAWTDPKTKTKTTRPLFSGTIFHRVIPGFMIQGGDPTGTGMGDGGLTPLPDEFSPSLKFDKPGRLAMANAGPRTGTCQFFITEAPTPHLDGLHTIFGQVVEGQDLVTKIANVPKDGNDKPKTPVKIVSVKIIREGPAPAPAPAVKKSAPAMKKTAVPPAKP